MNKEKSLIFPLVMGILSLILLGIYIWDSYYLQSSLRMAIFVVPVLSTVGIIFSLIVRKTIYQHRIIWLVGFFELFNRPRGVYGDQPADLVLSGHGAGMMCNKR